MLRPRPDAGGAATRARDAAALRIWVLSRVATGLVVTAAAWLFATGPALVPLLERWRQWDAHHYIAIAESGYRGRPTGVPLEAFFPGFPLLLRALHAVGLPYLAAGLLISLVAGAVAVVALARVAALDAPALGVDADRLGERAALLLVLAPSAVFLAAPYSEALFLGFALPAWLAARRGRWALAGLLAAGAASVRVTGLFLAVALVVEFAVSARRRWSGAPWLALPAVPVLAFMAHLHALTGDWLRWLTAQQEGWRREFTSPVEAWRTTWEAAFGGTQPLGFAWMFRAELVAAVVGVVLLGWLVRSRRWAESAYVGLTLAAYVTSTWLFSVPRATLLWWPLWIGLAALTLRTRWAWPAYLTLVAPLSVVVALLYGVGRWAG